MVAASPSVPAYRKDVLAAYNKALHESEADHQLQTACHCLLDYAHLVLTTADADLKAVYTMQAYEHYHNHSLPIFPADATVPLPNPPTKPARPSTVREVKVSELVKLVKGDFAAERIRLLHSLCHIESYAIELAWDIMLRFANRSDNVNESTHNVLLPTEYYEIWLKVAKDEATHYRIWRNRLHDLGSHYGALPCHDLLWTSADQTSYSLLARASIVHAVHEAKGCDTSPRDVAKLNSAGDKQSASLLQRIEEDEVTHVGAGMQSLLMVCKAAALDPVEQFQCYVRKHCKSASSLQPPFNTHARDAAGLTGDYYLPLVGTIGNKPKQSTEQKQVEQVEQLAAAAGGVAIKSDAQPESKEAATPEYIIVNFDSTNADHLRDWRELGYEWLKAYDVLDEVDIPTLEQPQQQIIDKHGMLWLLYNSADLTHAVGTIGVVPTSSSDTDVVEVCKLYVQPKHQGHGLAQRLMQTAIDYAKQHQAKRIMLESNAKLSAAVKLYERCGFRLITDNHQRRYVSADVAYELLIDAQQPSTAE